MNLASSPEKAPPFRITIDDLGLFAECEESVLELGGRGIPLYASWLTNYLPPTNDYLKKQRDVHNGLHFNVLEGKGQVKRTSLINEQGLFYKKWWDFLIPTTQLRRDVELELENQVLAARKWFGNLSHIDSHLHLHAIPWISELCQKAAKRFNIPHVRNSNELFSDSGQVGAKTGLLNLLSLVRKQSEMPCYGISVTFGLDAKKCVSLLREGKSREFVFHTCIKNPILIPANSRFVTEVDMEKRFQEHLQVSLLLDYIKRDLA